MRLAPIKPPVLRNKPRSPEQAKQALDKLHDSMHFYCCSTIAQFDTPQQILYALRGALRQRWKDWENTGNFHGNINSESIRIASTSSTSTSGILSDNNDPGNPVYKSLMCLKGKWANGEEYVPDYLDDLESFYYVLGFISVCFTGPLTYGLDAGPPNPSLHLSKWMLSPSSPQAIREKEAALNGSGFTKGMISEYFKVYRFGILLDEMHSILKNRLLERKERRLQGLGLLSRDQEPYRVKANEDHEAFNNAIGRRLDALEQSWRLSSAPAPEKPQSIIQVVPSVNIIALRRYLLRVITAFPNPGSNQCSRDKKTQ